MLPSLEQIQAQVEAAVPGARLEIILNTGPANQPSLLIDAAHGAAVARYLRDTPELRLDYCSNATGVDWPSITVKEKVKVKELVNGIEKEVDKVVERKTPEYLEAVYHLYSMALKHGPLVIRMRTENRSDKVALPSLTPVWRSCEYQEREIFDLFGIQFEGHPDLRRILMWEGFADHPMRKDYVEPDDYEFEPTPHDEVLEKAKRHFPAEPKPAEVKS
jgi:NADH-quinone oxidoreductase subunit C